MAKHTIKLKKYLHIIKEFITAAAVTPGYLVELTTAGTVQHHSSAGGNAVPMFVLEDELFGNGIDTDVAIANPAQIWVAQVGEEVLAQLKNGETAVIGSLLESAGDGTLQVHVADVDSASDVTSIYPNQIVAMALEAVDMSGSSGVDPTGRIAVMVV